MSKAAQTPQPSAAEHVMQIAIGYIGSMCLYIAGTLGVADLLKDGPKPCAELAKATGVKEDGLYRVLRALASMGVFTEVAPRKFGLTPAAEALRSDAQGSILPLAIWISDPLHFRVHAELMHSVKTGEITFDHVYGKPAFDYMAEHREISEIFNAAMTSFSQQTVPAVLEAYDFSGIGTLMDVAGGHGFLLTSVLKKYPAMKGILFDMEHVIKGAKAAVDKTGTGDRCALVSGDFFKALPAGADTIIMKHIIHDWDDDKATVILKNCHKALEGKQNGKVLVVDAVLAPGNEPHFGKLLDLEMIAFPGGRERTEAEFAKLFAGAGLRLTRVVPTKSPVCVVEAVPA